MSSKRSKSSRSRKADPDPAMKTSNTTAKRSAASSRKGAAPGPAKAKSNSTAKRSRSRSNRNATTAHNSESTEFDTTEPSDHDLPTTPVKNPGDEPGFCDRCKCPTCEDTRLNPATTTGVPVPPGGYCEHCECPSCTAIRRPEACSNCDCKDCLSGTGDNEAYRLNNLADVIGTPGVRQTQRTSGQRKLVYDAALQAVPRFKFPAGDGKTGFCLITLLNGACCGAQQCHILPLELAKNDETMSKLEYSWGIKHRGLNVHSRYNHLLRHWALAPLDTEILDRFVQGDFTAENSLQDIYDDPHAPKLFRYAFVAFPPIEGRYIGRCNEVNLLQPPTKANPVTLHYYPFSTLPVITSHVRPHYVVYDLGKKLTKHAIQANKIKNLIPGRKDGTTILSTCLNLFEGWMKVEPPNIFKGPLPTAEKGHDNGPGEATGSNGAEGSGIDRKSARSSGKPGLRPDPKPSTKFQSGRAGGAASEVSGGEGGSKRRDP
ncbi:hypothetical protein H0H92_015035 [Tricholoma furcatifolium]|nr:hypothetical protein H0H92_015035 [Tricholoma furcatifolium]